MAMFLIIFAFTKILYFLRVFESFGFLVQMVGITIIKLIPFLVFFLLWVLLFTVNFQILRAEVKDEDNDYMNLAGFWKFFFMSYRNAIGDL